MNERKANLVGGCEVMSKGRARHDPNKKQNLYGSVCSYYENGYCEIMLGDTSICKGNPHNCIKTKYHALASMDNTLRNKHQEHNNGRTNTALCRNKESR